MKIDINIKEKCRIDQSESSVIIYIKREHIEGYYYYSSDTALASIRISDLIEGNYESIKYMLCRNNRVKLNKYISVDISSSDLDTERLAKDIIEMYDEYIQPRREELRLKQMRLNLALEMVSKGYKKSNNRNELDDLGIIDEIKDLITSNF